VQVGSAQLKGLTAANMLLHQHLAPPDRGTSAAIRSLVKVVAELKGEVEALRQAVVSLQGRGVSRAAEGSSKLGQSA
jgi:signal transduction histidine kinase